MSRIKIRVTTKGAGDGGRAPRRTTFKVTTKGTGNSGNAPKRTVRTSARTPRGGKGGKNVVRRTRKA